MGEKAQAIKVEALKAHTYNGEAYEVGDVYDFYPSTDPSGISVDAQLESLANTGFALRVDRVKVAKEAAAAAEKSRKEQAKAAEPAKPARVAKKSGRRGRK